MTPSSDAPRPFTPELFRFLREIAKHNDRDWFLANKARYLEHVQAPSFDFVRAVGPKLAALAPKLVADPSPLGGSVMRVYRDIRFSRDKSPYRTSVGIRFMHGASRETEEHLPGFFLHIAPGASWVYGGLWKPDPARLEAIRHAIVTQSAAWRKVRSSVPEIEGESLKRAPSGYDPKHPFIDDLRRKGFSVGVDVPDTVVTRRDFPDRFVAVCRTLNPLNRFLAKAVGVPY